MPLRGEAIAYLEDRHDQIAGRVQTAAGTIQEGGEPSREGDENGRQQYRGPLFSGGGGQCESGGFRTWSGDHYARARTISVRCCGAGGCGLEMEASVSHAESRSL